MMHAFFQEKPLKNVLYIRKRKYIRLLRDDQAAMAAFFCACFLVLADSPVKLIPASSTVHENTGMWPGPDRTVV